MNRSRTVGALPAATCDAAGSSGITGTFANGPKSAAIPVSGVRYPCIPHQFATNLPFRFLPDRSVRLACLSHAASVRSEPGSNSPLEVRFLGVRGRSPQRLDTTKDSHSRVRENESAPAPGRDRHSPRPPTDLLRRPAKASFRLRTPLKDAGAAALTLPRRQTCSLVKEHLAGNPHRRTKHTTAPHVPVNCKYRPVRGPFFLQ